MIENGTVLAGRYEIITMIGAGGMSDVYKALDTSLNREVAIKVLKEEYVTDNAFVSKFRTEATAAAALEHPNIVNVYDVGNDGGRHFIVMEYVEGVTLKTYIAKKGRLSTSELLSVAIQVGRGIEAAHNKQIIHRDIKPQNIMISKDGKVKVTDFGIARAVTSNTINADRMGSVHYSSPEQTRNGFVTYQSDIYSLGIVMYEMCTGYVPFDGETTVAIALKHLQSEMIPPSNIVPDVPISVEKIIIRATMKTPERRYENVAEMLTDLKKALISPNEDFVVIPPAGGAVSEIPTIKTIEPIEIVREKEPVRKSRFQVEPEEEDDDDEEGGVSRKMDKAVTIMGIAAAVVIIIIVIYLLGSFLGLFGFRRSKVAETSSISAEMVKVPTVIRMTEEEAKKTIEDAGFVFQRLGDASSSDIEEGLVMDQTPKANESAAKGSTISVMISSGEGNIEVPSVVGYSQEEAMSMIKNAGFEVNIQQEYSDSIPQGKVIRQNPEARTKGNKGDTISIWISRGSELVSIPGVVNYTQDEATNALTRAGFGVNVVTEESSSVEAGRVIRQSATGQAQAGTTITITVSSGKKVLYEVEIQMRDGVASFTLNDPNGGVIGNERMDISTSGKKISNIPFSSGTIHYFDADGNELGSETINFTPMN